MCGINERTKIIFISHITSQTALIFPVEEICKIAKSKGIITIIDGAHAPGHIDLDITQIGCDYYTGACHKWMCAPKGSSFLYVAKNFQKSINEKKLLKPNFFDAKKIHFIINELSSI